MKAQIYQHGKLVVEVTKPSITEVKVWARQYNNSRLITTSGDLKSFYNVKNNKVTKQFMTTYGGY